MQRIARVKSVHNANTPEVFWQKSGRTDNLDACWLWTKCLDKDGYGKVRMWGKQWRTHQLAWVLTHGAIPAGFVVMHTCDVRYAVGDTTNRRCDNPAHLGLGTPSQNTLDRHAKGRTASHALNGRAKLSEPQVAAIREAYAHRVTQVALAQLYGMSQNQISTIVRGAQWR